MALAIAILMIAAACGEDQAVPSVAAPVSSVSSCQEIPVISAPPDAYADTPIYVANEMPVEEVRTWAMFKSGFESIWIDREHNGWITLAFSEEAAARQAEVRKEFPGVGLVVVEVPWRLSDLAALQTQVHEVLGQLTDEVSSGVIDNKGVVEVQVAVLTDEIREAMNEHFAGRPVCIDGGDPADYPEPGPQPEAGDGWRLLVNEPEVGEVYRTGLATDQESLRGLWATIGLGTLPPQVDFENEIVIWFGAVYGSSCPDLRLDDVVVDGGLVYPLIVFATPHLACTDDANPRAFVVAVHREKLPIGPFAIQLSSNDPPPGAPEERTLVDADLSVPGATAGPDQVGPDPLLPSPPGVSWGDYLEPGFPMGPYLVNVHCGIEWLGEFNGYMWHTDEETPDEWLGLMTPDQNVPVSLLLSTDPEPLIEASAGGATVGYRPTDEVNPGCD